MSAKRNTRTIRSDPAVRNLDETEMKLVAAGAGTNAVCASGHASHLIQHDEELCLGMRRLGIECSDNFPMVLKRRYKMNWAKRKEAEDIERKKLGGGGGARGGGKAEDDSILKKIDC